MNSQSPAVVTWVGFGCCIEFGGRKGGATAVLRYSFCFFVFRPRTLFAAAVAVAAAARAHTHTPKEHMDCDQREIEVSVDKH